MWVLWVMWHNKIFKIFNGRQLLRKLVFFLRGLAANEVLLRSNAMLVLFLRGLAANEVLLSSNAMTETVNPIAPPVPTE